MTSVRPPSTRARPASTVPPPFRIAATPGPTRTTSSKTTRTSVGARTRTAPFAGSVRTSVACANAEPGNPSAASRAMTRIHFFTSGDLAVRALNTAAFLNQANISGREPAGCGGARTMARRQRARTVGSSAPRRASVSAASGASGTSTARYRHLDGLAGHGVRPAQDVLAVVDAGERPELWLDTAPRIVRRSQIPVRATVRHGLRVIRFHDRERPRPRLNPKRADAARRHHHVSRYVPSGRIGASAVVVESPVGQVIFRVTCLTVTT